LGKVLHLLYESKKANSTSFRIDESINDRVDSILDNRAKGKVEEALSTKLSEFESLTEEQLKNLVAAIPVGTVLAYSGTQIPRGWLICDGAEVQVSRYPELFKVLGAGNEPGSTETFLVPDLRGRTVIGAGKGIDLTNRVLATTVGAETHTLSIAEMPKHAHRVNDPGHDHKYYRGQSSGGDGAVASSASKPNKDTTNETTGITIESEGGGRPHNILQPSLVLNYIIRY